MAFAGFWKLISKTLVKDSRKCTARFQGSLCAQLAAFKFQKFSPKISCRAQRVSEPGSFSDGRLVTTSSSLKDRNFTCLQRPLARRHLPPLKSASPSSNHFPKILFRFITPTPSNTVMKYWLPDQKVISVQLLVPQLTGTGHEVTGVDVGFYRQGLLYHTDTINPATLIKDIRHLTHTDLTGQDAVVHMAELSNDPTGELSPTSPNDINHKGSVPSGGNCIGRPASVGSSTCHRVLFTCCGLVTNR